MISIYLFFLSGVVIATMLVAKRLEEKKKSGVFLLKLLKHGDERAHDWYHRSLHYYSIGKERTSFWVKKLIPLKSKSYWNKFQAFIKNAAEEYAGDIRNSKLLKRSDGISEFFKSIGELEKGGGEINETLPEVNELTEDVVTAVEETFIEPVREVVVEKVEEIVNIVEKPKKTSTRRAPSKPRAPRKKKLVVVEAVE